MKTLRELALSINSIVPSISVRHLTSGVVPPISLRELLNRSVIYQLTLERLTCHKTESLSGSDHCRLEVFTDGSLEFSLRHNLNNNQSWDINRTYAFTQQIVIKLWDKDSSDPDDRLGTIAIPPTLTNHATALFKQDAANYTLQYSVNPLLVPQDYNAAQQELALFAQSTSTGQWSYISKADLIADIKEKIANPFNVKQESTPLCGPAAILFELVRKQPKRYVQICRQLWETGQFQARTKTIKPSDTLLNSSIKDDGFTITPADWMFMATLRDVANLIFDVDANSGNFVMGLSVPGEMKGWTFEMLGYDTTEFIPTFSFGEIDAMETAQSISTAEGVAFLMIDATMLGNKSAGNYPDHWIVFLDELAIDNTAETINFQCYSWGKTITVSKQQDDFEDYMFGVVTGI